MTGGGAAGRRDARVRRHRAERRRVWLALVGVAVLVLLVTLYFVLRSSPPPPAGAALAGAPDPTATPVLAAEGGLADAPRG